MIENELKGKVVLVKLNTKEEVVGTCTDFSGGHITLEKPYSLILANGEIKMIPFQFGAVDGVTTILSYCFITVPMEAPEKLKTAYQNSTTEIQQPNQGQEIYTGQ